MISSLMKAVAAIKADKANGLDMIAKVEGGFRDRDLYTYCFNLSDGTLHPFAKADIAPIDRNGRNDGDPWGLNEAEEEVRHGDYCPDDWCKPK